MFVNTNPDSPVAVRELKAVVNEYPQDVTDHIFVAVSSEMGYVLFRYEDEGEKDRYIKIADYVKNSRFNME